MSFVEFEWCTPRYQQSLDLRHRVLRAPLGLRFTAEELDGEFEDRHFGWLHSDETLVATVTAHRVTASEIRLRQMAVEPDHQRSGFGRKLLSATETLLADEGWTHVQLNARETAIAFYQRAGYETSGELFEEVGLPHQKMVKELSH